MIDFPGANLMVNQILRALGLPAPGTLLLEDAGLLDSYCKFCAGLSFCSDEQDAIRCDSDFFSFYTSGGGIGPEHYSKLRLLCALMRPSKKLLKEYDRDLREIAGFEEAVQEFGRFRDTEDYRTLTQETTAPRVLGSLNSLFSNAPGVTSSASLVINSWSRNWSILLFYGDADDDRVEEFPKILGFARRSTFPRSAAVILSSESYYTVSAEGEVDGDDFLAACWVRHGEEGGESLGPVLLALDEEALAILSKEYSSLTSPELFEDIRKAETFAEDYLEDRDGVEGLERVFQEYGDLRAHQGLEKLLQRLEREESRLELEERAAWEREQAVAKEAARVRYLATPILRPSELPPEMTVDQLAPDQRSGLVKWMQEELHLEDCKLSYGEARGRYGRSGLGYYEFKIVYTDTRGRQYCTFREPFPSVAEAFKTALNNYLSQNTSSIGPPASP